jgi:hypothetical protein
MNQPRRSQPAKPDASKQDGDTPPEHLLSQLVVRMRGQPWVVGRGYERVCFQEVRDLRSMRVIATLLRRRG